MNNVTLDYNGFVSHRQAQKEGLASLTVTEEHAIEAGDQVAASIILTAVKKDGSQSAHRIISIMEFRDGKMINGNMVVQMLSGNDEDRNMGSNIQI